MKGKAQGLAAYLTLILATMLPATPARTDGCFLPKTSRVATSFDQLAVMVKTEDDVTMTLSTQYSGDGEDFAWIIPVKGLLSPGRVYEAPEDLSAVSFLSTYSAPEIEWLYETRNFAGGALGMMMAGRGLSSVAVIDGLLTDNYEVSVLKAKDKSSLVDWLLDNGYSVAPRTEGVLGEYIREGWSFVAVKIRARARGEKRGYPRPICVRYKSEDLVFPLRVSSVSTKEEVRVILMIIGESTFSSSNFGMGEMVYRKEVGKLYDEELFMRWALKDSLAWTGKPIAVTFAGRLPPMDIKEPLGILEEYEIPSWALDDPEALKRYLEFDPDEPLPSQCIDDFWARIFSAKRQYFTIPMQGEWGRARGGEPAIRWLRVSHNCNSLEWPENFWLGRLDRDKTYYLTRLETIMTPDQMIDDVHLEPDEENRSFAVKFKAKREY